ncbi:MAG: UDP-N-acetylmuramate:L-alanyl-gamma-D-glutamyl-meso-diaminopimelate ligase [Mariprofundus sp.]
MAKHLHILGVCGTAMAAIAALAKSSGWTVSGSDAGVYPPMSDYLSDLGIEIAPFDVANLKPAPDLCVIGNAMSRGNVEVEAILDRGLNYCSGPQFVGDHILTNRHAVVVAGTHGKTTTSSLLAHVLETAGIGPGFLIGGVPEDFGGGARLGTGETFVLEGDEYDTAFFDKRSKFLHYHARTLILNNLEYDHADIFPDLEAIKQQFHHLIRTVPASGAIIANADEPNIADVLERGSWTPVISFSRYGGAQARWQWEAMAEDGSAFRLYRYGEAVIEAEWDMIGVHNVANACAVAAVADALAVEFDVISDAFRSFSGIRRRMTLVGEAGGIRVFDDFAHHPTAISSMVAAAKAAMRKHGYAGKLWVIVEPRSNTMRTRIHQHRLPECFEGADEIIFLRPSDRNLQPEQVLDVRAVCDAIHRASTKSRAHLMADTSDIIAHVRLHGRAGDEVLILSNGGFDGIHQRLLDALSS